MNFKKFALVTTGLAGVIMASSVTARAQDAAPAAPAASSVSEIVVTGYRKSLEKALAIKKKSDDVVEVVSAESIGKFPDTNLAESLAHIPGVSVDRQFGEGDRVSIDGTDPALNRIFIDGHSIASASWGGDPQDTSGRNFNYSYLSPDIISQLELYKNPEAWLDEGSLGGTTLVTTRKPFDQPANTAFASGGYQYNDRSAQGDAKGSVAYSWKNDNSTFGVIGAFTYSKENLTRGGIEYFGYDQGTDFVTKNSSGAITGTVNPGMTINGQAPTTSSLAALAAARYPAFISYSYFQQTRERYSFSGDVSWRPMAGLEFDLTGLLIRGEYNNYSQAAYSYDVRTSRATNANVSNGLVTSATYEAAPATGPGSSTWNGELDENYRETAINNNSVDLAYKWDVAGFKVSGDVGYTEATGGTEPEYQLNWRTQSGFTYGFNGTQTSLNYATSPSSGPFWLTEYLEAVNSPSTHQQTVPGYKGGAAFTGFQVGGIGNTHYYDDEVYAKVDVKHDVEFGPFTEVLFGAKFSDHDNSTKVHGAATYGDVANGSFDVGTYGSTTVPTNAFSGLGASGNSLVYSELTASQIVNVINSLPTKYFGLDTGTFFNVREEIASLYGEARFRGDKYHGNIGVRIVGTQDESNYFVTSSTGAVLPTTTVHTYVKPLPSFNFAYDAAKDVVLHVGIAEVIARPRYSDLAGAFSFSTNGSGVDGSAGGGNPNLKPYDSINYEVSAEWYFKPKSLLSAELFYRDVQNYVLSVTSSTPVTLVDPLNGPGQYYITSPENAGKAEVEGFSVTYQYDIGMGFGFISNYTFSSAETALGYNMPFLSRHVANFIPYYENGPWEARVSLNYRSHYFTDIGRLGSSDNTEQYRELDAQLAYKFAHNLALTFNASNLLDEQYYSYSSVTSAPTGIYKNGRLFSINFSYKH
jgi:iron complex outermembrane receptor protein